MANDRRRVVRVSSVSDPDSNRRITFPDVDSGELFNSLITCFRDCPRYQNVIAQDLRPLWKRAQPVIVAAGLPRLSDFDRVCRLHEDQLFEEEDGGTPHDPDLARYVEKLRWFVSEKMRLARSGEPEYWATIVVHSDVVELPVVRPSAAFYGEEQATIALRVTPVEASIEARGADGGIVGERRFNTTGFDFDYWTLLEAEAQKLLSEQIATLREQYERRYPKSSHPRRNRATLDTWRNKHVPALFRLLFFKDSGGSSRDTLRRVADTIGIDLPPA
jgi:hypothetical protein